MGQAGCGHRHVGLCQRFVEFQGPAGGGFSWSKYDFSRHKVVETCKAVTFCQACISQGITWVLLESLSKKLYPLPEAFGSPFEQVKPTLEIQPIRVGVDFAGPQQPRLFTWREFDLDLVRNRPSDLRLQSQDVS